MSRYRDSVYTEHNKFIYLVYVKKTNLSLHEPHIKINNETVSKN